MAAEFRSGGSVCHGSTPRLCLPLRPIGKRNGSVYDAGCRPRAKFGGIHIDGAVLRFRCGHRCLSSGGKHSHGAVARCARPAGPHGANRGHCGYSYTDTDSLRVRQCGACGYNGRWSVSSFGLFREWASVSIVRSCSTLTVQSNGLGFCSMRRLSARMLTLTEMALRARRMSWR